MLIVPLSKSSEAGNPDMPKRRHKGLPLSENVQVLHSTMKAIKSYGELTKNYGQNQSSISEIVGGKLCKFHFCISVKVTATVCGRCKHLHLDGKGIKLVDGSQKQKVCSSQWQ